MSPRLNKSLTLLELLIALGLITRVVLAFMSVQIFSNFHLTTSGRQTQLQNEISLALAHMSKYVQQGVGPLSLETVPAGIPPNGFRVRVDRNATPTPANINDDSWVSYALVGNTLSCNCTLVSSGAACTDFVGGDLASHILSGVSSPTSLPAIPAAGFYINITNPGPLSGSTIEVALAARWDPASTVRLDNPQVVMKTKVYATSASAK